MRDPRVEPMPRDVLSVDGARYRVRRNPFLKPGFVEYEIPPLRAIYIIDLANWQAKVATATIIHAEGE